MEIRFKEKISKTLLCHLQLSSMEVNKKVIDLNETFADCKEILLVTSLSGINSNLSWDKTKIFFEDDFKEKELLVLMLQGRIK